MQENKDSKIGAVKHGYYPAQGSAETFLRVKVSKSRTTLTVGNYEWVFELQSGKWIREG